MKPIRPLLLAAAAFISLFSMNSMADQLDDKISSARTYREIIDLYRISMSKDVRYRENCVYQLDTVIARQGKTGHDAEIDTIVAMVFADTTNSNRLRPIILFHSTEYEDTLIALHRIKPGEYYNFINVASSIGTIKTAKVLGEFLVPPYIEPNRQKMYMNILAYISRMGDTALFLYPLVKAYADSYSVFFDETCSDIKDIVPGNECYVLSLYSPFKFADFAESMKKRIGYLNTTAIENESGAATFSQSPQSLSSTLVKNPFLLNGKIINDQNTTTTSVIEGGHGRVKVLIKGAKK